MDLPRLMLVADGFTRPKIAKKVCSAVFAGVRWIQLRDHGATSDTFDHMASRLIQEIEKIDKNVLVTVNSRLTIAQRHGLTFHTGRHGPSLYESKMVLGPDSVIGMSTHDGRELAAAVREKADYVTFSPIFETTSHPGMKGVGMEVLRNACFHAKDMPVIAMGGITPETAADCIWAGAHGVAVHSSILSVENMIVNIREFSREIPGL